MKKHKHKNYFKWHVHKLRYCQICDVVYCKTCGEEWVKQTATWTTSTDYQYPTTTSVTSYPADAQISYNIEANE